VVVLEAILESVSECSSFHFFVRVVSGSVSNIGVSIKGAF
jgi:hypothetical protein